VAVERLGVTAEGRDVGGGEAQRIALDGDLRRHRWAMMAWRAQRGPE
jgi:hypothetical protein